MRSIAATAKLGRAAGGGSAKSPFSGRMLALLGATGVLVVPTALAVARGEMPLESLPLGLFLPVSSYVLSPETLHSVCMRVLQQPRHVRRFLNLGSHAADLSEEERAMLRTSICGHLHVDSPVGMAAGFDKNASCVDAVLDQGFGFVEVGSVVPEPQQGNPLPRVFKDDSTEAVINRYGLPSEGVDAALQRLKARFGNSERAIGLVGANVAANKISTGDQKVQDYVTSVTKLYDSADFLVINVSCPNVPQGDLDATKAHADVASDPMLTQLRQLLGAVVEKREEIHAAKLRRARCAKCVPPRTPLFLKLSPDLDSQPERLDAVLNLALEFEIDGIVAANTTALRPSKDDPRFPPLNEEHGYQLEPYFAAEKGGLSGRPLRRRANALVRRCYSLLQGRLPIVGVGGISTAEDAYERLRAGASVVELYSAVAFRGLGVARDINKGLVELLRRDGYANVSEVVGLDCTLPAKPE